MKPLEAPRRNTEDPKTQGSLCLCIKEGGNGNRKKGWFQVTKNRFQQGSQWAPQPDEGKGNKKASICGGVCVCVYVCGVYRGKQ